MGRLTKHRKSPAVVWEFLRNNKFGKPIVSAADEIMVRWVEKMTESLDANNTVIRTDVRLTTDGPIPVGSIIRQGTLVSLPDPVDSGLYRVVLNNKVPNLKNNETKYTVFLVRHSNTLPEVSS